MSDETTPQDSAAMSPASAGSVRPVAWAAVWPDDGDGIDCGWVYDNVGDAFHAAAGGDGMDGRRGVGAVVKLYRQPQPTLTDAEREALERQARSLERDAERSGMIGLQEMLLQEAATLRGWLERTKPLSGCGQSGDTGHQ